MLKISYLEIKGACTMCVVKSKALIRQRGNHTAGLCSFFFFLFFFANSKSDFLGGVG